MRIICSKNGCYKMMIRRSDESITHFNQRRYCCQSCANSSTQGDKNRLRVKVKSDHSVVDKWLSM